MASSLLGGLALFLFGMEWMANTLKAAAGERMQWILASLTRNRFIAAVTGALVTAVIQSSSVTTVLVVGFISAQLLSLPQALGVIMGANIGATGITQIMAFNVTHYALPMIGLGFAAHFFSTRETIQQAGNLLLGLGLLFFGMALMSEAMKPLQAYPPFLELIAHMSNPLLAIAVSAGFTALIQSSSATTGIIIVMASQGFFGLHTGIALILGANIGTCATALLASIGKPREAVRAALAHVLFNVLGVLLWFFFIGELGELSVAVSPQGAGHGVAELPRQLANANTLFNLLNTMLFLPIAGYFARLLYWLIPERPGKEPLGLQPKYLDSLLLSEPSQALAAVRRELQRMSERIENMLGISLPAVFQGDRQSLKHLSRLDNEVDSLHGAIISYLGEISKAPLAHAQTQELFRLMEVANSLENVGDLIETDLVVLGQHRIERAITVSPQTQRVIRQFYEQVTRALHLALEAVQAADTQKAGQVLAMRDDIDRMIRETSFYQVHRLSAREPGRIAAYSLETDLMEKLRRVYDFAKRIARSVGT